MSDNRFTRAFDAASTDFDRLATYLWNPIGAAAVGVTAPASGELVLDACCGSGASAIPAARRVGPEGRVDAVDMSTSMIAELVEAAGDLPQLHPHVADVTAWPQAGYDVVQAVLGIFFFADIATGTDHLVQCARPGGRVGLTIWRRGAMEVIGDHLRRAVTQVTGVPAEPLPTSPITSINEADAFESWLLERPLSDVTIRTHELRIRLTPEIAWLLVTGSGFIGALADLQAQQIAEVRRGYLDSLRGEGIASVDATTLTGFGTRAR